MKNNQCPSCGGDSRFTPLRHCQQGTYHECDFRKNVCTSDEWLANATQSTRDLANKIKSEKLQVTLQDSPLDIELARYKRMFESACVDLGLINEALGLDPDNGGAKPIIEAIKAIQARAEQGQKLALSVMSDNGNMFVG